MEFKEFGKDYAEQTVKNAKRLAEKLAEEGLKVLGEDLGFTESHQVAVDVKKQGGGAKIAKKLERANIVLNKNLLPWDSIKDTENPSGIRIGVQEVTRLGMKEDEMDVIAKLIADVILDRRSVESVREDVISLKREFSKVKYTFEEHEAYEFLRI